MKNCVKTLVMLLYILTAAIPIVLGFIFEILRTGFKCGVRSVGNVENWCAKED